MPDYKKFFEYWHDLMVVMSSNFQTTFTGGYAYGKSTRFAGRQDETV